MNAPVVWLPAPSQGFDERRDRSLMTRSLALCHSASLNKKPRRDTTRCEASRSQQARQDSNLQRPVLERTPSTAGVAAFVDFQRLSFCRTTPALLDNAGVGTNPGTEPGQSGPRSGSTLLTCLTRTRNLLCNVASSRRPTVR